MYTSLFLWDCSSIGQSTALSRRKLRVRAPSVPTRRNQIQYFFFRFTFLIKQMGERHMGIVTIIGSIIVRIQNDADNTRGIEYLTLKQSISSNWTRIFWDMRPIMNPKKGILIINYINK